MEQYKEYMDRIVMDENVYDSILNNTVHKPKRKQKYKVYRNIGWAAGIAVCILSTWLIYGRFDSVHKTENQSAVVKQEDAIIGLPVNNYVLEESPALVDRIVFSSLSDLVNYSGMEAFVYVKVLDTDTSKERWQDAMVKALSIVGEEKPSIPSTFTISQSFNGGCIGDKNTNLVRKDGVYLVPVVNTTDGFEVIGDLDVLFEVDDKGRIWTHSSFKDFTKFDGMDHSVVTKEISKLIRK